MLKSKHSLKKNKPNNNPIKSGIYLSRNVCLQKKVMKYDLKVSQSSSEKGWYTKLGAISSPTVMKYNLCFCTT